MLVSSSPRRPLYTLLTRLRDGCLYSLDTLALRPDRS